MRSPFVSLRLAFYSLSYTLFWFIVISATALRSHIFGRSAEYRAHRSGYQVFTTKLNEASFRFFSSLWLESRRQRILNTAAKPTFS